MARFRSYAKLNLHLEVLGRRDDGFHELRTLFQSIDLHDDLEIELASGEAIELEVVGADLPSDARNLAYRAAAAFRERWGGSGARIALRKRIPLGSGLGGGSSNAATVLLGLCRLRGLRPSLGELEAMAGRLGADVPFFLHGGTALATGRGDHIARLPDPLLGVAMGVALPPLEVSTAAVFAAHAVASVRPRWEIPRPAAEGGEPVSVEDLIGWNELQATCFRLHPGLVDVYNALSVSGARAVRLSGSGAALFAVFATAADAAQAGSGLPPGVKWLPVRALGREEWLRQGGFDDLAGGD